jgi:hypothetical protein
VRTVDISSQVMRRAARMGALYLIIALAMGFFLTATFSLIPSKAGTVNQGQTTVDVSAYLQSLTIPFVGLVALIAATPVTMLFVFDKNAGVLEYLLAVGMSQREVFKGYLKAALAIGGLAMAPSVLLNIAVHGANVTTAEVVGLGVITAVAVVSLVTVLMTSFSSMQRKPTGMNSPLGIGVGVFAILPELILGPVIGANSLIFDAIVGIVIFGVALGMLVSIDRLISREKLLP